MLTVNPDAIKPKSSRKRVLLVSDFLFHPSSIGNRKRVASLVSSIRSQGFEVHVLALDVGFPETELEQSRRAVDGLETYAHHPKLDPYGQLSCRTLSGRMWRKIVRHARQWLGAWPPPLDPDLEERCPSGFCCAVQAAVERLTPIAVIVEYVWLSRCFNLIPDHVIKILDIHDLMHLRLVQYRGSGLHSFFQCTLDDELRCLARADKVLVIQAKEKQILGKHLPESKLLLTPHAHAIHPPPAGVKTRNRLLFLGSSHAANVEGLHWFLRNVWPNVLKQSPGARVAIVGSVGASVQEIHSLQSFREHVDILGVVDDAVSELHQADVLINPILRGSGLKIKVVESLCCGLPVVSTSKGVEGIPGIGVCRAVRIADDETAFADAVHELLVSPVNILNDAALEFARTSFSASAAYGELLNLLVRHSDDSSEALQRLGASTEASR